MAFVDERLNGEDGLGAIFPAMVNAVLMYDVLGVPADDPRVATARESIERLLVVKDDEAYCQPCLSPVWDTALPRHALLEVGDEEAERGGDAGARLAGAAAGARRHRRLGGAAARRSARRLGVPIRQSALSRSRRHRRRRDGDGPRRRARAPDDATTTTSAIARGREWIVGLQSKNGGWAAFDADNTYDYLNNIPFADHGALLDPPTADVTARCVSMLAQLDEKRRRARRCRAGWHGLCKTSWRTAAGSAAGA